MTALFLIYFVPMLLWYASVAHCFYKDWYDGDDIRLSHILWVVVFGITPLLNIVVFVVVCYHWWETSLSHIKIKGIKQ